MSSSQIFVILGATVSDSGELLFMDKDSFLNVPYTGKGVGMRPN